ncbi:unnamed protein product [Linum tenue]|uniref:Uncharacterized protein n=1 Tax=Linum tenue TaxID=586396 RepID=A0AAV0N538_9ROSI|nr:unnamed protein product [Linum tenue]
MAITAVCSLESAFPSPNLRRPCRLRHLPRPFPTLHPRLPLPRIRRIPPRVRQVGGTPADRFIVSFFKGGVGELRFPMTNPPANGSSFPSSKATGSAAETYGEQLGDDKQYYVSLKTLAFH